MISPQTKNTRILEFQLEFQNLPEESLKAIYNVPACEDQQFRNNY